ncbi:MAG: DUF87 domain-containing protein [Vicinamibacterales bacterium]
MTKLRSIIYLLVYLGVLVTLRIAASRVFPALPDSANELWFASGLLLVVLGVLVTEKHFTRPLDVVVNAITVIVVLQTIDVSQRFLLFSVSYGYALLMGFLALVGFALSSEDADPTSGRQQLAHALYRITGYLGGARVMFSAMFAFAMFEYVLVNVETAQAVSNQEWLVLLMIAFWVSALLIEPFDRAVVAPLLARMTMPKASRLGRVARRYEPRVIMVAKTRDATTPSFGSLAVVHPDGGDPQSGRVAMYLDDVDTDEGRFLQFYILGGTESGTMPGTQVTAVTEERASQLLSAEPGALTTYGKRQQIAGTVAANSNIDVVNIRMLDGVDQRMTLAEGDLLSIDVYGQSVKYQVIGVRTDTETVSGQNKAGMKYISAQQIGAWDSGRQKFIGATWVPDVNAVVFQESNDGGQPIPHLGPHCFKVGVVPKSPYPVYIDFNETITHHLAIIGKTGTGKSQMAARIVEGLVADGYKVVILEVDRKHPQSLSKRISPDLVAASTTSWSSKLEDRTRNGKTVKELAWSCKCDFTVANGRRVFVIDLDEQAKDMDGGPLSHAESACAVIKEVLVHKAKAENEGDKLCIVLEEAYDFIPENTFGSQDFGQPNVSRIAQLVLKCRKHQIGFLVITQRTALVSKTILYQCNTIIALQTFDETSRNFMSAYINNKYLESMSILPRFRAIVVGKGSSCDKPIIVNFEQQ